MMHIRPATTLSRKLWLLMLAVVFTGIIVEVGMRTAGWALSARDAVRRSRAMEHKDVFRILCLGESTTALGGDEAYPAYLERILNANGQGIRFSVVNAGVSGTKTEFILDALEGNLQRYKPDMVVAMMGINDTGSHMPQAGPWLKRLPFLRSLRVVRLWQYLVLHARKRTAPVRTLEGIRIMKIDTQGKQVTVPAEPAVVEAYCKKAIAARPESYQGYYSLGMVYWKEGRISEAREFLEKAVQMHPPKAQVYVDLGQLCQKQGRVQDALTHYKAAASVEPDNAEAWYAVARISADLGQYAQAEECFRKASALDQKIDGPVYDLGWLLRDQGRSDEALVAFQRAAELNPRNSKACAAIGWIYRDQGRLGEAQQMLQKALREDPRDDAACAGLGVISREKGDARAAKAYFLMAKRLRASNSIHKSGDNYQRMHDLLKDRGIPLVCVQYPLRSVALLKSGFQDFSGVIFVDNEDVFRRAVEKDGYRRYFKDMFAGDFGHCTAAGNELLAQNVANTILAEYFKKRPLSR